MSQYELVPGALADLDGILLYTQKYSGDDAAADLKDHLLDACDRIAAMPGLGHRRDDLTSRPYFFYAAEPYLIIHARQVDPLPVLAFFHSARDIKKLLRSRRFR